MYHDLQTKCLIKLNTFDIDRNAVTLLFETTKIVTFDSVTSLGLKIGYIR